MVHIISRNHPFFWDTVLTSTIAQWFYENGTDNGITPLIWDSGHPTLFQLYLSSAWKILGKSLYVSHLAILPFLIIMVFSFVKIIDILPLSFRSKVFSLLLFLLHPYILTQTFLISYDIIQVAMMLSAFAAMMIRKKWMFLISLFILCTLSLRGQAIAIVFVCIAFWFNDGKFNEKIKLILAPGILVISVISGWHLYHYYKTGWMIFTPSESWQGQRDLATWNQIFRQTIGFLRGFIDYGSIALSISFLWVLLHFKSIITLSKNTKYLLILILSLITLHLILIIPFSNPAGHRYFMSIQALMIPLIVLQIEKIKQQTLIIVLILTCFISSHFWIYPKGISNGWDVTLAHSNYFNEKIKLSKYLTVNQIDKKNIASSFPMFVSERQEYLYGSQVRMLDINESKIGEVQRILVSNICNDITDEQLSLIEEKYIVEYQSKTGQIHTILYKLR
jgi:hypothetical protein